MTPSTYRRLKTGNSRPRLAGLAGRWRHLGLLLAMPVLALGAGCTKISPDETGVRTLNFGKDKGIVQKDYEPGYHRYLWPLDSWHRFPSTVQHVRFSKDGARATGDRSALQLTSADGDRVAMNAHVFFRIADDSAFKVLQDSGPGDRFREVVMTLAQDRTRVVFGKLRTEEFYDQARRDTVRRQAAEELRARLEPRGVELIDLLVETVEFEPDYENLIKEKKIADQRVELAKAEARAAEEQGKVALIRVDTHAMVEEIKQRNQAEIRRLRAVTDARIAEMQAEASKYETERGADGSLYAEQKGAEGQRLINKAKADGTNRLNQALSGEGGRNLVALEALRKLQLTEVTFPSIGYEWFNPFDMAIRIGAGTGAEARSATADSETPITAATEGPLTTLPEAPPAAAADSEGGLEAAGSGTPLATVDNP